MKHILVVDDSKTSLAFAKTVLSEQYKVAAAVSGAQALKFLENNSCDLILLDINMPEMDGFEVMQKIRENEEKKDIPIIFLTADNDSNTESRCLESGAVDFIAKPFAPVVMLSRIRRTLEHEDMKRQLADKTERKIKEVSDSKSKSRQDSLTGLWNRTYTENAVNRLIEGGAEGALFIIDMGDFKAINDNYGHIVGDNTLKMLAQTMQEHSREGDVLCRIGEDEFVMFLNGAVSKVEIGKRAGDIISDFAAKIEEKKFETNTFVSIGIAQIPEDGKSFSQAYNSADKALYYVKQNGKNAYRFFSEQKISKKGRSTNLVDVRNLQDIMSHADSGHGTYQLDLESFNPVCNFIRQFVERNGREVQTLLFTADTDEPTAEQEDIDEALDVLEQAIYASLRKADVSAKYSGKQVIVILMDANAENGEKIAGRIVDCFKLMYNSDKVRISYDIAKTEGKIDAAAPPVNS